MRGDGWFAAVGLFNAAVEALAYCREYKEEENLVFVVLLYRIVKLDVHCITSMHKYTLENAEMGWWLQTLLWLLASLGPRKKTG